MQKIFYVSRNEDKAHDGKAPDMDPDFSELKSS